MLYDIRLADERRSQRQRAARRAHLERQAVHRERERSRPDVGWRVDRVGHRPRCGGPKGVASRIVEVGHADAARRQHLEEPALRPEVVLHVPMKIEMIAREVGEHRGAEMEVVDTAQRQGVRGCFDHARTAARIDHVAQHPLQFRRLGCRPRCRDFAVGDLISHRPDAAALDAGCLEDRREKVRRRRLAVRARDPDQHEVRARVAEERRGERGEREPGVGHLNPWRRRIHVGRRRHLCDDGDRPARDGLARERGAVRLEALQRDEHRSLRGAARIARD